MKTKKVTGYTVPIPVTFHHEDCEFEHNFGCWGEFFVADFKNKNDEVITRSCCEAHKDNPRLTQGNNVTFGIKVTEWKRK